MIQLCQTTASSGLEEKNPLETFGTFWDIAMLVLECFCLDLPSFQDELLVLAGTKQSKVAVHFQKNLKGWFLVCITWL